MHKLMLDHMRGLRV
jgi:hypothetical protein